MLSKFTRGMVYYANIPNILYAPTVQAGHRPVIIVSNDIANVFSQNITVVPCTSNINKKDSQPTHVTTKLIKDTETIVLCENIMTLDKSCLESFVGVLDDMTMAKITEAIGIALGFTNLKINDRVNTLKDEHKPERKTEYKPKEIAKENHTTIDRTKKTKEFMKNFLEETESKGAVYVMKKYGLVSQGAVYQRCIRYKKLLDTK